VHLARNLTSGRWVDVREVGKNDVVDVGGEEAVVGRSQTAVSGGSRPSGQGLLARSTVVRPGRAIGTEERTDSRPRAPEAAPQAMLTRYSSRTASCLKKHRRLPRSGCGSLRGGYLSALRYAEFGQY
jgi:hypothetical protein